MTEPEEHADACDACGKPARQTLLGVPFCGGIRCGRLIEAENLPRDEPTEADEDSGCGEYPW